MSTLVTLTSPYNSHFELSDVNFHESKPYSVNLNSNRLDYGVPKIGRLECENSMIFPRF